MWSEKYKPKSEKDLVHNKEVNKLKTLIEEKKHSLIYGPTGIGKTAAVYIIADLLEMELIELNASSLRNKENIENIIGNSSKQASLFKKGKIILIDEIDSISSKDRGFISSITEMLKISKFPIVMVANNLWSNILYNLRKKVNVIEFKKPNQISVMKILENICKNENLKYSETELKKLSHNYDIRSSINDLELYSVINKELDIKEIDERDIKESIFNALKLIFKSKDFLLAYKALENVNEDLNTCMLWLDENIPIEYKKNEDIIKAYDKLSKADIFSNRIKKWQHWRFLVYQNILMTSGVSLAKKEKYNQFTNYKPMSRILKVWRYKQKNIRKMDICKKIAEKNHISKKTALENFYFLKKIIVKNNIYDYFKLSDDEIDYLKI